MFLYNSKNRFSAPPEKRGEYENKEEIEIHPTPCKELRFALFPSPFSPDQGISFFHIFSLWLP